MIISYKKNSETQALIAFSADKNSPICNLFKNNAIDTHKPLNTSTPLDISISAISSILIPPIVHLDKQVYTVTNQIPKITSFFTQSFGPPAINENTVQHKRKTVMVTDQGSIIIYSDPLPHEHPLVVCCYGASAWPDATNLVQELLSKTTKPGGKVERYYNTFFVIHCSDPDKARHSLICSLTNKGYRQSSHTRKQVHLYKFTYTWTADWFRITLRNQPLQPTLAPGILQIDRFKTEVEAYVDLAWILNTLESLHITVKPIDIEYQLISPGGTVEALLQKTIVKGSRNIGYCKERGKPRKTYSMNDTPSGLQESTHYIGTSRSNLQCKIYKKPARDPKLEIIMRREQLKSMNCSDPEALFNLNPWNSISKKIMFGSLCPPTRRTKNFSIYENAQQKAKISLCWAKQSIPNNPYRYVIVDENLTESVRQGFSDLTDLLQYVWLCVVGKRSDVSTQTAEKASKDHQATKIFQELNYVPFQKTSATLFELVTLELQEKLCTNTNVMYKRSPDFGP